ncbi:hypothetical protein [Bacillus sp. FSL K6-6540]|uniref:hypothetical protein n=1 Tax=Bacillus sp. FSL K6-6540 TaxID=2921512 RepID=UPI0030F75BE1
MKKSLGLFAVLLLLLVTVVGCGSGENKDLTLEKFIKAYQDEGIEVDPEKKPVYNMINAKDGVIFTIDRDKVAIYEYASEKDLDKNMKDNDLIKDWPRNGRFLLESDNGQANEIFKSVN